MKNLQKAETCIKFVKGMEVNKDTEGMLEITAELLGEAGACLLAECEMLRGNMKVELETKVNSSLEKLNTNNTEGAVYLVLKELENIVNILKSNLSGYNVDLFSPVWVGMYNEGTTYLAIHEGKIVVYSRADSGLLLSLKELYITRFNKAELLKMLNTAISSTGAEVDLMSVASQVMFLLANN